MPAQGQTQASGSTQTPTTSAPTVLPTTTSGTSPVTTTSPTTTQQTAPSGGGVLGQTETSSPSTGSSVSPTQFASSTQRATQQSSGSSRQLPFTGGDVPLIMMLGGVALGAGALLRRRGRAGAR